MQPTTFPADLPPLIGDPPPAPEGLRAALLQRDLTRALDQLAPVRAAATDLSRELQYAHLIIRHALAVMTAEQKVAWAELNAAAQCDGEGITRANEREQSLRRAMRALVS